MSNENNKKTAQEIANDSILTIRKSEQFKTIDELIPSSQPNAVYTWLLTFSTIIIVSGLLLNNGFIVVGGMIVTPVLTPILTIALSLATGELRPIKQSGMVLLRSAGIILLISMLMTVTVGAPDTQTLFEQKATTTFLYLLVAFASGVVATIGLVRKDIPDIFPGIAIAISLVPPLSLFGIWLASRDLELARYFLIIFLSNVVGFIIGSLIVFSALKFYKSEKRVKERAEKMEAALEAKKAEKTGEKNGEEKKTGKNA